MHVYIHAHVDSEVDSWVMILILLGFWSDQFAIWGAIPQMPKGCTEFGDLYIV